MAPAPIPGRPWSTPRPQTTPLPIPGLATPPLGPAPKALYQWRVPIPIATPRPPGPGSPRPRGPTRGDEDGDGGALAVPDQRRDSHRVADSALEAAYFCGVRASSGEHLLSRGAT